MFKDRSKGWDEWKPEQCVIDLWENYLQDKGFLDELIIKISDKTIGGLVEALGILDVAKEWAQYLKENFDQEEYLTSHRFTGRGSIEAMKEGTPAGICYYSLAVIRYTRYTNSVSTKESE